MVNNDLGWERRRMPVGSEELKTRLPPYYAHVIKAFTPHRCMFESNFPVEKECVSFRVLFNGFKRIVAEMGLAADEKRALFSETATKVYRLNELVLPSPVGRL